MGEQANLVNKTAQKVSNRLSVYGNLIFYASFLFVIILVSFIFSENYRINKCVRRMNIYKQYIVIDSILSKEENQDRPLKDFYIASSFRSCLGINQRFDYVSLQPLTSVIESGARLIWFDIFNENMNVDCRPVVSNGRDLGNWKYTLNTIYFEDAIKRVAQIAFSSGYVNNYNDPLFIALNLNVQNNLLTLNKIKRIIVKHLRTKLLPSRYGFISKNIANVKIKELLGKVVILTSGGYDSSDLKEIINYSWDKPEMRLLNYKGLSSDRNIVSSIKYDKEEIKTFNAENISLVLPEENSIFTNNYDTRDAFNTGCQFVLMNYQKIDQFMDKYTSKFKNSSFILRPSKFSGKSYASQFELDSKRLEETRLADKEYNRCPGKPGTKNRYVDSSAFIGEKHIYKKDTDDEGLCFFSTEDCNDPNTREDTHQWIQKDSNSLELAVAKSQGTNFIRGQTISKHLPYQDEFKYESWKPKICCAKKKFVDPKDLYTLSPDCNSPDDFGGSGSMKVTKETSGNVLGYTKGISDDKYNFIHPKVCKIEDEKLLRNQKYCTLSKNKCPDSWTGNIDLENGWKMCCKNMN